MAEFVPETVPSYVVRQVFEQFREKPEFQKYLYKDATLNPTNPRDQANDFETQLVNQFREDEQLQELHGFQTQEQETLFYVARPLAVTESGCLVCHSTPEAAPENLIRKYGTEGGFGWQLNEIIAAQIIYVPARNVLQAARQNTRLAVSIFMGIFALALFILNGLLKRTVLEPLKPMAKVAQHLSEEDSPALPQSAQKREDEFNKLNNIARQGDELGQLARIFQRMAKVVYSREQGLRQQLQDVLDEVKHQDQESQDTYAYIQKVLQRSRELRHYFSQGKK
ncbi:MAG: DUF3365 domain-containing protein [Kamptonema sp. SIO4C4]|nr:DUF3365 domain-containing protein [Kamptonema sp. SIO4C4]